MDETQDAFPAPVSATVGNLAVGMRLFERFELLKRLGQGGMGIVWLARDHRLDREVALKFLPDAVRFDPDAIADLKRETQRSLKLTHPNIVRIHDFEQSPDLACISMEYVDGKTLAQVKVERGCLEISDLIPWLGALGDALSYAHETVRLVHRDLKPANLMMTTDGHLKIADFGIAKSVADSVSRVSMHKATSGTPAYASPQQMAGDPPSPQDDIYAIGATLYDLLTGRPPFFRGDVVAQAHGATPPTMAQRREEFGLGVSAIPAVWEETIAECLKKNRADRPASIRVVTSRLLGTDSEPVTQPHAGRSPVIQSPAPASSTGGGRLALWIVGGIFLGALLVGAGVWISEKVRAKTVAGPTPAPVVNDQLPKRNLQLPPPGQLLKEARELRRRGALANARDRLHDALDRDPQNPELQEELDDIHREMGPPPFGGPPPPPPGVVPVRPELIAKITASSTLPSQVDDQGRRQTYEAANAIDRDPQTAWVAARGAKDIRLEVTFRRSVWIHRFSILPGYGKNDAAFSRNNRVKEIVLHFPGEEDFHFVCSDRLQMQGFELPRPRVADTLTISVVSVYEADKFKGDTPISEIGFE